MSCAAKENEGGFTSPRSFAGRGRPVKRSEVGRVRGKARYLLQTSAFADRAPHPTLSPRRAGGGGGASARPSHDFSPPPPRLWGGRGRNGGAGIWGGGAWHAAYRELCLS